MLLKRDHMPLIGVHWVLAGSLYRLHSYVLAALVGVFLGPDETGSVAVGTHASSEL